MVMTAKGKRRRRGKPKSKRHDEVGIHREKGHGPAKRGAIALRQSLENQLRLGTATGARAPRPTGLAVRLATGDASGSAGARGELRALPLAEWEARTR
eukprot:scaffold4802_cov112-Isochrysis_galbana.AAC.3